MLPVSDPGGSDTVSAFAVVLAETGVDRALQRDDGREWASPRAHPPVTPLKSGVYASFNRRFWRGLARGIVSDPLSQTPYGADCVCAAPLPTSDVSGRAYRSWEKTVGWVSAARPFFDEHSAVVRA